MPALHRNTRIAAIRAGFGPANRHFSGGNPGGQARLKTAMLSPFANRRK